ncbi:MAG: cyanophycinase [Erythrobacter sp.]
MRLWMIGLALLLTLAGPLRAGGTLVIVGGGLADDNDAVFAAFLAALPAPDAPIAIIPAASGVPVQSARAFAAQLERRGVDQERIRIIRLATEDDPATAEDESGWAGHGEAPDEIMKLAGVGGIWFTGGDQARIMASLMRPEGDESAMLAIIRTRFAAGAVIGGTSAGAAIMSNPMILQGDPFSLVPGAGAAFEKLASGTGLGFLRHRLVDQHFGERTRLIRLVAALREVPSHDRIGLGIDEDTALVVAPDQRFARVVGRGRVTVLDAREAAYFRDPPLDVRRLAIVSLADGDVVDLAAPATAIARRPPASADPAPVPCLAAPSAGRLAASESQLVGALAARIGEGEESLCLISAGAGSLALRFYRRSAMGSGPLLLDIVPVVSRLELRQR